MELASPANPKIKYVVKLRNCAFREETGEMIPSETVIAREIALQPGGESMQAEIRCEMAMGTRFYRASTPIQLCVPVISVSAHADGTQDGRLNPGDAFAYRLAFENAGRVYCYDVIENKLAQLHAFFDLKNFDVRTYYDRSEIKILDVEENGNVSFIASRPFLALLVMGFSAADFSSLMPLFERDFSASASAFRRSQPYFSDVVLLLPLLLHLPK